MNKEKRCGARKTNVERVTEFMEYSKTGALAQIFVMEAIGRYADQVLKAGPEACASAFIDGEAWCRVAQEWKGDDNGETSED